MRYIFSKDGSHKSINVQITCGIIIYLVSNTGLKTNQVWVWTCCYIL